MLTMIIRVFNAPQPEPAEQPLVTQVFVDDVAGAVFEMEFWKLSGRSPRLVQVLETTDIVQ